MLSNGRVVSRHIGGGGAMNRYLRLGVNIDHVATLRNARGGDNPDPVRAAQLAGVSLPICARIGDIYLMMIFCVSAVISICP